MKETEKDYYLCEELAESLRLNVMTVYRYIDAGKLEAYKIGRHYRIKKDEFERFLESVKVNKKK